MRKTQNEVKAELERRYKQYESKRRLRNKQLFGGGAALAICLVAVLLLGRMPFFTAGHVTSSSSVDSAGPAIDEQSTGDTAVIPDGYNLMANIRPMAAVKRDADDAFVQAQMKFAIDFLHGAIAEKRGDLEAQKEKGVLICPLSAELALAMTANGADGETLRQIEKVLGNGISIDRLNEYLHTYTSGLPSVDGSKLDLANSIWFPTRVPTPYADFLQTNADYYGAGAFQAPLDELCGLINDWVKEHTDGMIEKLFDELPENTVMVLVNTVLFDGAWKESYAQDKVREWDFTAYGGTQHPATLMSSTESVYLRDESDGTIGFLKPYANDRYAFVALLPEEDVDILDYASSLTAGRLQNLLKKRYETEVKVMLPKFTFSGELSMNDMLKTMGMPLAFSEEEADFSRMFDLSKMNGNLFIGKVQQNTAIEVSETGTKAAAATGFVIQDESAPPTVLLNRPFVYMILDTETDLPLFLGVLTDVETSTK